MRRRFVRRRFTRLVRPQRPTWISGWDFQNQSGDPHTPAQAFTGNPTTNVLLVNNYGLGLPVASIVLPLASGAASQVIDATDVAFFEGELSVLRIIGNLRLHGAYVSEAQTAKMVEVRSCIFKGFEQEANGRISAINPFIDADKDVRVIWSASWITRLFTSLTNGDDETLQFDNSETATRVSFDHANRSVRTRNAVKIKGNERLIWAMALAPARSTANVTYSLRFSGYGRCLIKH